MISFLHVHCWLNIFFPRMRVEKAYLCNCCSEIAQGSNFVNKNLIWSMLIKLARKSRAQKKRVVVSYNLEKVFKTCRKEWVGGWKDFGQKLLAGISDQRFFCLQKIFSESITVVSEDGLNTCMTWFSRRDTKPHQINWKCRLNKFYTQISLINHLLLFRLPSQILDGKLDIRKYQPRRFTVWISNHSS